MAHMARTMVADPAARPDVLPTDRLMDNGMARPELPPRAAPDRQPAQRHHRGVGVAVGGGGHRRSGVDGRPVVGLPGRLHPDGSDVRPLRHPHARGGPQAPVHQQAGQRLGRHLAHRLPDLDPHLPLPPGPLRPPQGGVRPPRAGHRLLRRLPLRPGYPGAGGWCATRWASRGGRTSPRCSRP